MRVYNGFMDMLLSLLACDDHEGISEDIEFAKGKYKLHTNVKQALAQRKREMKWRKINGK
jgi:hypothetical protein